MKGFGNAQKLITALEKVSWRDHKVTAKMPQFETATSGPSPSPGQKRKVTNISSYTTLLQSKTFTKCPETPIDSEDDMDDDMHGKKI